MDNVSVDDHRMISRYLALDVDQLYALIPPHLAEYDSTMFSPEGQEEAGRNFIDRIRGKLQAAICEDFDWPAKKGNSEFNDRVNLVATIADVISGLTLGVPPFIVATLLVKQGLNKLCAGYNGDEQQDSD